MAKKKQEESDKKQIVALLERGFSRTQLISTFGLAQGAVDEAIGQFRESKNEGPQEQVEEGQKQEIEETKSNGNDNGNSSALPVVVKNSEAITPEAIIQHFLYNGSVDWQLRIEGMMLLRAAQKMNREDVEIMKGQTGAYAMMMKPILETMIEISREQDAAARRAMGSNEEIAQQAAVNVSQHLTPQIQALKSQIAASSAPDPMSKMMNFMQMLPQMLQLGQQLMGSMGLKIPGLLQGQVLGQSPPGGGQLPPQTAKWEPPPVEKHSLNELEGRNAE